MGVPGLVDGTGTVRLATALGWRDVTLAADLRRALRAPGYEIAVDNDANLAVLAEYRHGPYAGTANLIHLTGGAGIGAGVVADSVPESEYQETVNKASALLKAVAMAEQF